MGHVLNQKWLRIILPIIVVLLIIAWFVRPIPLSRRFSNANIVLTPMELPETFFTGHQMKNGNANAFRFEPKDEGAIKVILATTGYRPIFGKMVARSIRASKTVRISSQGFVSQNRLLTFLPAKRVWIVDEPETYLLFEPSL